jgi:hypothetical protein
MGKNPDRISNAELAYGKRLLHPEWEVEVSQFNYKGFGHYGGRVRQWLALATADYFVVQSLGTFRLYETRRCSYEFVKGS